MQVSDGAPVSTLRWRGCGLEDVRLYPGQDGTVSSSQSRRVFLRFQQLVLFVGQDDFQFFRVTDRIFELLHQHFFSFGRVGRGCVGSVGLLFDVCGLRRRVLVVLPLDAFCEQFLQVFVLGLQLLGVFPPAFVVLPFFVQCTLQCLVFGREPFDPSFLFLDFQQEAFTCCFQPLQIHVWLFLGSVGTDPGFQLDDPFRQGVVVVFQLQHFLPPSYVVVLRT
mmetsp:Transcript_5493/g.33951  ORF Transcript_5493/g.33951 Transcript_5493/m.33951 type:complete len:221 (-) Transcript_5493:708-1370(-)